MIAERFRDYLKADLTPGAGGLTCWQRVGAVDAGPGSDGKACFVFDPPPELAEASTTIPNRFILTLTETSGVPWDTRGKAGLEFYVTIRVYGPKGFTDKHLCDMAFDLAKVLHRAEIAVPGYDNWGVWSDKPEDDKDNLRYPAYRFRVRVLLLAT